MKCVIILAAMSGILQPGWLRKQLYDKSHIANGIAISRIMTCCVLLVMSPVSDQNVALDPAPTNDFDMQLEARTRDWEDKTVATKCSKCGRARDTVPVEGKAMTAAATSAAGRTPLTVENVQKAVLQALATQAPAAAAFAGMHEFARGSGFTLEEHTAFGAIAEGKTEDEEGTAGEPDNSLRRGHNQANQFTCTLSVMAMGVGSIFMLLRMLIHLGTYAGEVGSDMVTTTRAWASAVLRVLMIWANCFFLLTCLFFLEK